MLSLKDHFAVLKRLKLSTDFAPRSLRCLAGLGAEGSNPGSCHRDLLVLLGTPNFPEAHVEAVPMKVLKPHRVEDTTVVSTFVLLAGKSLCDFWKEVRASNDPRLEPHAGFERPAIAVPWQDGKACAGALHGDAVPSLGIGKSYEKTRK